VPHWHALSPDDALERLHSARTGLTGVEAARRLAAAGPNRLPEPPRASAAIVLRDQFTSVVVYLLIAATAISLALGETLEAGAIAVVLAINTTLGFVTELRARRAMEAILRLDVSAATVLRDGRLRAIDAEALVPGDIVDLKAGGEVPADARLIEAIDLRANEAALTGESLPVSKDAADILGEETPLADRTNMIYAATAIVSGIGRAVVCTTGAGTEAGRVSALTSALRLEPTPLERRLDALGHRLVWLALAIAAVVAALAALHGEPLPVILETGIALAVAAVPEALPAVATIALAIGMRRMAKRNALVRRLAAVESLGSATVVCSDKTRTLTSGRMSVVRLWAGGVDVRLPAEAGGPALGGRGARALVVAARASPMPPEADGLPSDPVDAAMIAAAKRVSCRAARTVDDRLVAVIPFSTERKWMATLYRADGAIQAFVKGAPRRVLALCAAARGAAGRLDDSERDALLEINDEFARAGLRVLGVASGRVADASERALRDLTFEGFVGLADPPDAGVKETIARLRGAGLRTVMLTGDQRLTAAAIGRELGLFHGAGRVIDARELDAWSEEDLRAGVVDADAFSRITPEHKLKIVSALQARGEVVAMLGDGVNDAPALRRADVGVAMGGRGTDAARQAAAVVLRDDRFETIGAAIEEGRVIFDNIRKFVFYLFSCNVAELMVLLVTGFAGYAPPLAPLQILWLNLITDTLPALALAVEPADDNVMARPPRRPEEAILSGRFLAVIFFYAGLITTSTLVAFVRGMERGPATATTLAFMTLALAQIAHLGNARSSRPVTGRTRATANRFALAAVVVSVALQMATVYVDPLRQLLQVSSLSAPDWAAVVLLSVFPAVTGQILKRRRAHP
jgi:Ca2+-transporting ATPase